MESRRSHVTAFARATVGRADRGKESNKYGKRIRTTRVTAGPRMRKRWRGGLENGRGGIDHTSSGSGRVTPVHKLIVATCCGFSSTNDLLTVHAVGLIRGNSTWVDERYLARPHSSSRLSFAVHRSRSDTRYRWYPALTILIPEHFGARASCRFTRGTCTSPPADSPNPLSH